MYSFSFKNRNLPPSSLDFSFSNLDFLPTVVLEAGAVTLSLDLVSFFAGEAFCDLFDQMIT